MMKRFLFLLGWLAAMGMAGCANQSINPVPSTPSVTVIDEVIEWGTEGGVTVAVTTGMIADLVTVIGGEHVQVFQLVGVNVDPRIATLDDERTALLNDAELVFYHGLGLEAEMLDALIAAEGVAVGDYLIGRMSGDIPLIMTDIDDQPDPYIWHDPRVWIQAAEIVRDTLIEADSANADTYTANYDAYFEELRLLDEEIRQSMMIIPNAQRILITPVNAFRYFQREFAVIAQPLSGETLDQVVNNVVSAPVPAIFPVTTEDYELLNRVVREAQSRGHTARISPPLYALSLAAPGEYGSTYVDMMRYNMTQIRAGLIGGDVE